MKHEHRDINDQRIRLHTRTTKGTITLRKLFPPITTQHDDDNSVAHAVSSVLYFEQKKNGIDHPIESSVLWLHSIGKGRIRKTLQRANKVGVASEDDLPHDSIPPYQEPSQLHFQGDIEYYAVPANKEVVNSALAEGHPIIIGYNVYDSFLKKKLWDNDGVMPVPKVGDTYVGAHAGVIVGLTSTKDAYEVRNSWGTDFKNDGYFYMPTHLIENKFFCCSLWALILSVSTQEDEHESDSDSDSVSSKKSQSQDRKDRKDHHKEPKRPPREQFTVNLSKCAIREEED